MEKQAEASVSSAAHRRLSQMKILARLVEHELDTAKGNDVTLDRDLMTSVLDALEIYIEDFEGGSSRGKGRNRSSEKPAVTRLN